MRRTREQTLIVKALDSLLSNDAYLLVKNLHEQAITHRLGIYLQEQFPEWNVDCEWDRNLGERNSIRPKEFIAFMLENLEEAFLHEGHINKSDFINGPNFLRGYTEESIHDLRRQLRDQKRLQYDHSLQLWYFILNYLYPDDPREFDPREFDPETQEKKYIRPDIVCHVRGTEANRFVIEAKKSTNKDPNSRLFDLLKLHCLVSQSDLHYENGYAVEFPIGKDSFLKFTAYEVSKSPLSRQRSGVWTVTDRNSRYI